jgi:hypothetical protein
VDRYSSPATDASEKLFTLPPDRRVRNEDYVPGVATDIEKMDDDDSGLEAGHESIYDLVCRPGTKFMSRHLQRDI